MFALIAQGLSFVSRAHIKSQVCAYILSTGEAETGIPTPAASQTALTSNIWASERLSHRTRWTASEELQPRLSSGLTCTPSCSHLCTFTHMFTHKYSYGSPVGDVYILPCACGSHVYKYTHTNTLVGHMCMYTCVCIRTRTCTHTHTPVGNRFLLFLVPDLEVKTAADMPGSQVHPVCIILQNGVAAEGRDSGS